MAIRRILDSLLVQPGLVKMNSVWVELVRALAICGFHANSEGPSLKFDGSVVTKNFDRVNLTLVFKDTKCLDFPFVYFVDEKMKGLYRKIPHFNQEGCDQGDLCYIQRGVHVFDVFNPYHTVLQILEAIKGTLDLEPKDYAKEFTREILAYWVGEKEEGRFKIIRTGSRIVKVEYSKRECSDKLLVLGERYHLYRDVDFSILNYPFSTKNDLLCFGRMCLGKRAYSRFLKIVLRGCYGKEQFCLIFERNENLMGLLVSPMDENEGQIMCLPFCFPKSNLFSRNMITDKVNLRHKRILLIGCGTLGSNLLPMLIKSGAGFNQSLTIVDSDKYGEENFSRHYLGLPSIGKNKAEEMKDVMLSQCRGMNGRVSDLKIVAITKNFEDAFGEGNELPYDIILDTTGNESFSSYLGRRLCKMQNMPLYICGYIYGRSRAVCASVIKDSRKACQKCVDDYSKENLLPKLSDNEYIVDSCNSVYIPFPITASVSAANLMMTALFKALRKDGGQESVFWWQCCDDNVWGSMQFREIPKNIGCPSCKVS